MFDHADDNRDEIDAITSAGAYIMGRSMFGPGRGEWDLDWKGWKGWWGPESALAQARQAAADGRVAIAGGVATLNQHLSQGAIDGLRLHRSRSAPANASSMASAG
jgi:dihydrofolate reductase